MIKEYKAFTITYGGLAYVLITDVGISLPASSFQEAVQKDPVIKKCIAVWDTGATHSVITKKVALEMGLISTGKADVSHVGGTDTVNRYLVNIILPNNVMIPALNVTEGLLPHCDILVGMDVILRGDFAVTNEDGLTAMSFRMPSYKRIDFVPENNQRNFLITHGTKKQKKSAGLL